DVGQDLRAGGRRRVRQADESGDPAGTVEDEGRDARRPGRAPDVHPRPADTGDVLRLRGEDPGRQVGRPARRDTGVPVRRLRRVAATAAGWVVVAAGGLLVTGVTGSADAACSNFSVTSAADAVRQTSSAPGLIPVDAVDAQGPAAQAHVDSLGSSVGWA